MVNALAMVLANLDEAIIGLLRERERIAGTAYDRKFGSYTSAPFTIPFAVGEYRTVAAYERLVPSFWIGFEKDAAPVEVRQMPITSQEDNVPDHFYSVDIRVPTPVRSQWLTVERDVLPPPGASGYVISLAMKARATSPMSVTFELAIPLEDGDERRIPLAQQSIGTEYEPIFLNRPVDLAPGDRPGPTTPPKLLMFLPCNIGFELSIAYMYVLASARK